jgi:hypothetical protein
MVSSSLRLVTFQKRADGEPPQLERFCPLAPGDLQRGLLGEIIADS